ncbi:MAG: hypothetical protein CML67_04180 [Rhodobacteraceae bacterium]|nr:hypothetical protein [Paracoccaceae bacterium]|tara:strand:+ start:1694 stop:3403 length:1710 start_codon:yes stop_codon:yes gene_type:complete
MANILKFPENHAGTKRQAFLQDSDDTLHFDDQSAAGDHRFPLPTKKSYLEFGKLRAKDWSNQELANLFRVKRLLDAAGVPNEIDRGITDEGDPWFLFCDANGDVFIHLCRLDGVYVLDSPNINAPLRGRDFNALIEEFTARKVTGEAATSDTQRVVRLERNGKVFLHPSTMLAALVWTLFMAAEDLVVIMPEEGAGASEPDLSDDLVPVSGTGGQDTDFDPLQLALQDRGMQDDDATPGSFMSQNANDMDAFNEEKIGQNTYAIGLSAIAISLGFMSETQVTDVDAITLESILAMISGQDNAAEAGIGILDDFGLVQNGAQEFLAALTQFFDEVSLAARDEKEPGALDLDAHQGPDLMNQVQAFIDGIENQVSAFLHEQEQPRDAQPSVEVSQTALDTETVQETLAEQTDASAQETVQVVQMLSRFGLVDVSGNLETNAREYTFDNNTVVATFDVNARDLEKAADLITGSLEAGEPEQDVINVDLGAPSGQQNQFQAYDDAAYEFITFLMSKDNDLEMIATGNELILLDPEVFNVATEDTFTASWTLENGDVISTIGLRSDYEAYDLVG